MTDPGLDDRTLPPETVLLVHNRYQQGGGEDGVFEAEASLLERHGHRVARLVVDNDTIAIERGLRGQLELAIGTVWSRGAVRQVGQRLIETGARVMHVHNTLPLLSPAVHVAARRLGVPSVQTLHNYRLACPAATFFRDGRPCEDCRAKAVAWPAVLHACYRNSRSASLAVMTMLAVHRGRGTWSRDVAAFIALTSFARERLLAAGLPAGRVVVKPNFLAADPGPSPSPGDGYLYVGRLAEEKGIGVLLNSWRDLPSDLGLRIAGTGPLADEVRAAASSHPNVVPLGRLDAPQVVMELHAARALVVPSIWYEGFPLVVVEAFAAGRPVIASRHGSLAEIVTDQVTGLLFEPGDSGSLATAIRWADEHPADMERMGTAARDEYLRRYTAEANYTQLVAIYRSARANMVSSSASMAPS